LVLSRHLSVFIVMSRIKVCCESIHRVLYLPELFLLFYRCVEIAYVTMKKRMKNNILSIDIQKLFLYICLFIFISHSKLLVDLGKLLTREFGHINTYS
jgi:hypothetical protein